MERRLGQGLVEFAVVVPVLTLLIVGTVGLGLFLYGQLVVTTAAQEGARVASGEGRTLSEGRQMARQWLDRQLGGWADRLAVGASCGAPAPPGQEVCTATTVTVSVRGSLPLSLPPLLSLEVPVDVAITMHREGVV